MNYPKKNVGLAHGFKTKHVQGLLNNPWFYCTWFRRALYMVLKPYARPPNNPWFYCTWFRRALQMVLRPCARKTTHGFRRALHMVLKPCMGRCCNAHS